MQSAYFTFLKPCFLLLVEESKSLSQLCKIKIEQVFPVTGIALACCRFRNQAFAPGQTMTVP